jgi:hypothetical protein
LESILVNPAAVARSKGVITFSNASTRVTIISLALRLSRLKALPELVLALDSLRAQDEPPVAGRGRTKKVTKHESCSIITRSLVGR